MHISDTKFAYSVEISNFKYMYVFSSFLFAGLSLKFLTVVYLHFTFHPYTGATVRDRFWPKSISVCKHQVLYTKKLTQTKILHVEFRQKCQTD